MFERFTERARECVVQAEAEARETGARIISTDHLLLGVLRTDGGVAAKVLADAHVGVERIREVAMDLVIKEAMPEGVAPAPDATAQIPFTALAKTSLELGLREALGFGHTYIGTEHLLLGLERCSGSRAQRLLQEDFEPGSLRNEIIREMNRTPREPPPPVPEPDPDLREEKEAVDHPAHYGGGDDPYEVIKVIEAWRLGFRLGNAVKYIGRAGKKDPAKEIQDLKKARWYLDRAITAREKRAEEAA